jgi:hypothetical protein
VGSTAPVSAAPRAEGFAARQHVPLALLVVFLLASSPWLGMRKSIPADAGWVDYAHVGLGLAALALSLVYAYACLHGRRWRLYLPWLAGRAGGIVRDLAGLGRGRLPSAEGGGLYAALEGLLLLALLAAGVTGAGWLFVQGTADALAWREVHVLAARCVLGLLVAHVVTVSLHLLDFLRN